MRNEMRRCSEGIARSISDLSDVTLNVLASKPSITHKKDLWEPMSFEVLQKER